MNFSIVFLLAALAEPSLRCSPSVLRNSDTLTLSFSMPHPSELAVVGPDGTYFFLIFEPDNSSTLRKPLYLKTVFREMRYLKLKVSEARGSPWVAGREASELLFTKSGTYEFRLTETLETEDLPVYACKVKYRNSRN